MARGGKREGAGRKSKADEIALVERLTPMDDIAFSALEAGLNTGEFGFVKLFFEYRFGKPNEKVDITSKGQPVAAVINIIKPE